METAEIIRDILIEELSVKPKKVKPGATIDSMGIDSLEVLTLCSFLEERAGDQFPELEELYEVWEIKEYLNNNVLSLLQ